MKTPSIFISYRRSDTEGWAGRLSDSLKAHLAGVRIFRDIEEIPPGVDFEEYFTKAVGECDAFIEIIGPGWLTATDASGRRRLDDPNDPTRKEVVTAIRRAIRVIPVLLEGAVMPKSEELPEDLRPLARRNAYPLSDSRWADDTKKLAEILRPIVQPPRGSRRVVLTTLGAVAVIFVGIFLYRGFQVNGPRQSYVPNVPSSTSPVPAKKRPAPPARRPDEPDIQIQSAACTRIAREQFRVKMSGHASGPAQAFFWAGSNPNNGIDESMLTRCETWSQSQPSDGPRNQRMCKRGPGEPDSTDWRSTNIFRSASAPPEGCADLYSIPPGLDQATILAHRCTPLECR